MTDTTNGHRSLTVTWEGPMVTAEAARTMSGLEFLQAIVRGELPPPPIARLLGFELETVAQGRVVFAVVPAEQHYNPLGVVHGGLASTLFDSALACAVQSMLPAGTGSTTIELHVNFVRSLTISTGRVRCEAEVIHVGRSIGTAQARLVDTQGKLYGHATTTCMIFRPDASS